MTDYAIAFGLIMSIGVMLLLAPRVVAHLPVKVNARMTTHLLSGLLLSSLVLLVDNVGALLLAGFLASLGIVVVVEFGWLGSMLSGSRWRDYGFVFYAVGFLASVALYSPDNRAIVAGLVILAVADPLAAAVGRRLGRHTVQVFGARRTIEGSAAFAVATLLVAVLVLAVTGPLTPRALGMALFAAVTSAALELAVPGALDNLVIPLWVGFVFHVDVTIGPLGLEWTTALALAGLLSAVAVRARWLTLSGAAAAFLAGAAALAFGGVAWVLPRAGIRRYHERLVEDRRQGQSRPGAEHRQRGCAYAPYFRLPNYGRRVELVCSTRSNDRRRELGHLGIGGRPTGELDAPVYAEPEARKARCFWWRDLTGYRRQRYRGRPRRGSGGGFSSFYRALRATRCRARHRASRYVCRLSAGGLVAVSLRVPAVVR